jgi:hypothetical protein
VTDYSFLLGPILITGPAKRARIHTEKKEAETLKKLYTLTQEEVDDIKVDFARVLKCIEDAQQGKVTSTTALEGIRMVLVGTQSYFQ